jgi:hemoglobin-like flavoprotein
MTPERLRLIRESWREIEPAAADAATLFYEKLFELDPAAKSLFRAADMDAQRVKLVAMLAVIVDATENEERLVNALAALGRRHAGYGARDADYDSVGVALLWMLDRALGGRFTPELRDAWAEMYRLIAGIMRRAGERTRVVPSAAAPH